MHPNFESNRLFQLQKYNVLSVTTEGTTMHRVLLIAPFGSSSYCDPLDFIVKSCLLL